MIYYGEAYRVFKVSFGEDDADMVVSTELNHSIRKIVVDAGAEMLYNPSEAKILIKIYGSTSAYQLMDEVLDLVLADKACRTENRLC